MSHYLQLLLYFSVIVFGDPNPPRDFQQATKGFMGNLTRQAQKVGFHMANNAYNMNEVRVNNDRTINQFFMERFKKHESERRTNPKHKLQLVICIMPRKDSKMYSTLKFYAGKLDKFTFI